MVLLYLDFAYSVGTIELFSYNSLQTYKNTSKCIGMNVKKQSRIVKGNPFLINTVMMSKSYFESKLILQIK